MNWEYFHPSARRAYDEAGATCGIEGIEEWWMGKGLAKPRQLTGTC
jgi:hypothetical protein